MKKKQIGAAGLVAAVAVVYAGFSWVAGLHIESQSKAAAESINVSLARSWSDQVQLSLRSYERGIFSSRAIYALALTNQDKQADRREILWSNQIEHGPLPWSRIQRADFSLSGAVIQTTVLKNPTTEALFNATGGKSPLSGTTHVTRQGVATLRWTVQPFDYTQDTLRIKVGAAEISARIGPSFSVVKSTSSLDGLTLSDGKLAFEVKGLQLITDTRATNTGMQTGMRELRLNTLSWASLDSLSLGLQKLVMHSDLREAKGLLGGITTAEIGALKLNDKVWGEFTLSLGYEKLNGSALRSLLDFQDSYLLRTLLGSTPNANTAAADTKKFWQYVAVLSKTSPTLNLSSMSWKNTQGRSQLSLAATFNPSEASPSGIGLQGAPLKDFDATLSLSTPMLNAIYIQALQAPGANPAQVKAKADQETRKLLEQAFQL
ncbi:MAG: YdgA family protein, partial [Betaproteobacteria bacterium]